MSNKAVPFYAWVATVITKVINQQSSANDLSPCPMITQTHTTLLQ